MLFLSLSISVSGGYLRFIVIVFLLIISSLYGQMSKRFTSRVKELQKIIIIEVHMRDAPPAPQKGGYVPPLKITKTCGMQRGKVDPNPWKFGRQLRGRIQFCPKSVDLRTFLPRLTLPRRFFSCPAPPHRLSPLPCPALCPKSSVPCIPGSYHTHKNNNNNNNRGTHHPHWVSGALACGDP